MSNLLLLFLLISFYIMKSATSPKFVISLLITTTVLSVIMTFTSEWNGYFLMLVYVGGLLVSVFYLSSFTISSSISTLFLFLFLPLIIYEEVPLLSSNLSNTLLWSFPSLSLIFSALLILFSCLLVSQLLFTEKALRSFNF